MKTLGIALGVAVALVLVLFVGIKVVLESSIPAFQEKSRERVANLSIEYSESSRCQGQEGQDCHAELFTNVPGVAGRGLRIWVRSAHKTVSCENCHGPSQAHVDNSALIVAVDKSGELCMLCHSRSESKPSTFPQIVVEEHYVGTSCLDCHSPYSRSIADAPPVPHTIQGRENVCLSCHKAGLFRAPKVHKDHAGFTAVQCLTCHKGSVQ